MLRRIAIALVSVAVISGAAQAKSAGKNDNAIKNIGSIVAAMRKCDNLTVKPLALKLIASMMKEYGIDIETTNAPTIAFMSSQMEFEIDYKENPVMSCKLALAMFPAILEYAK